MLAACSRLPPAPPLPGECVLLEDRLRRRLQSLVVRGLEHHGWSHTCEPSFIPSSGTQTPAVAGTQPWKSALGPWGRQVVSLLLGVVEEGFGERGTDHVYASVSWTGSACPVPKPPCQGSHGTRLEGGPRDAAPVLPGCHWGRRSHTQAGGGLVSWGIGVRIAGGRRAVVGCSGTPEEEQTKREGLHDNR